MLLSLSLPLSLCMISIGSLKRTIDQLQKILKIQPKGRQSIYLRKFIWNAVENSCFCLKKIVQRHVWSQMSICMRLNAFDWLFSALRRRLLDFLHISAIYFRRSTNILRSQSNDKRKIRLIKMNYWNANSLNISNSCHTDFEHYKVNS